MDAKDIKKLAERIKKDVEKEVYDRLRARWASLPSTISSRTSVMGAGSTTGCTLGTASAHWRLLMNLSTVLMAWSLHSHSVDLKTILAKTGIHSQTSTYISQVIAAVVLHIRRVASPTVSKLCS